MINKHEIFCFSLLFVCFMSGITFADDFCDCYGKFEIIDNNNSTISTTLDRIDSDCYQIQIDEYGKLEVRISSEYCVVELYDPNCEGITYTGTFPQTNFSVSIYPGTYFLNVINLGEPVEYTLNILFDPLSSATTTSVPDNSSTVTSEPVTPTTTPSGGGDSGDPAATTTITVPSDTVATTTTSVINEAGGNEDYSTTTTVDQPFTDTTTSVPEQETCPIEKVLGESSELETIRKFRDIKLASSTEGMRLICLYYIHADEIVKVLNTGTGLKQETARIVLIILPKIKSALKSSDSIVLSGQELSMILDFLKALQKEATPGLKKDLLFIIKKLETGELLENINGSL